MEGIKANAHKIVSSSSLVSSAVAGYTNSDKLKQKDSGAQPVQQPTTSSEQAVKVKESRSSESTSSRKEISAKLEQIGNLVEESMSRLEEFASILGNEQLSSGDREKLQELSKEIGELNKNSISVVVKRSSTSDKSIEQKVDTVVSMVFPPEPPFEAEIKLGSSGLTAEGLAAILYSAEEAKQKLESLNTQVSQIKEELSTAVTSEVMAENLAASEVIVADVDSFAQEFGGKVTDITQLFNSHSEINPERVDALVRD